MEKILQKNKKIFPICNIIKNNKWDTIQNVDEKNSLIQIDNEKNYIEKPIIALLYVAILLFIEF